MRPETEHVLNVLRTAMRVLGFRNRDIERKLGASPGYLSRVFSGDIALRHDLIVDLARAMELEPGEIFRAAYPTPAGPPSPAAAQIRNSVASFTGSPGAGGSSVRHTPTDNAGAMAAAAAIPNGGTGPSAEEIEILMARALRRFFKELSESGNSR